MRTITREQTELVRRAKERLAAGKGGQRTLKRLGISGSLADARSYYGSGGTGRPPSPDAAPTVKRRKRTTKTIPGTPGHYQG